MKLRHLIFTLVCALCLSRCIDSGEWKPGTPVDLDIRIGTRSLTEAGNAYENTIRRIRVMAFNNGTGTIDANEYDQAGGGFNPLPIEMIVQVISGEKIICVLANEPVALSATLDGIGSLTDLMDLSMDDDMNVLGELPMTLIHRENIRPGMGGVKLNIERLVGKVRMTIKKDADNSYPVTVKSIQVVNAAQDSRIMPGNPTPADLGSLAAEAVNQVLSVGTDIDMAPLYLYEHYWGTGDVEDAKKNGAATLVEVKVDIERTLGSPEEVIARIPLIGAFDENGYNVYAVIRNTVSSITATVYGDGIMVRYTVLPWEEDEYEKTVGENDENYIVIPWVSPNEYDRELQ